MPIIKTEADVEFYKRHIEKRLPSRIIDAHSHIFLQDHVPAPTEEYLKSDWANECFVPNPYEDARRDLDEFLPGKNTGIYAFGTVDPRADLHAVNEYIAGLIKAKKLSGGGMVIHPSWSAAEIEKVYDSGGFTGFKPYPYMASDVKGADMEIFDFLPHEQLRFINGRKAALTLHLPCRDRLYAASNVRGLREICEKYPDIKIVVAHFGRSYSIGVIRDGLELLGDLAARLYYDTAAVLNPEVHAYAFSRLPHDRICYGTDMPIFSWHGRRIWTEYGYTNLCRENYFWNRHIEGEIIENDYILFIYEQLKNLLDAIEKQPDASVFKECFFWRNAADIFSLE